jgi:enoyl-CoA hydratase/carnithine racemase
MTKLMGRARTLEYLLSSGTASAEDAERMGWVNKAFPTVEALQGHVTRLTQRIATFSAAALAATKAGVNEQAPSEAALNNDLKRFRQLVADPETQRAVSEFLKRSEDQSEGEWELGLNHNLIELWPKVSK